MHDRNTNETSSHRRLRLARRVPVALLASLILAQMSVFPIDLPAKEIQEIYVELHQFRVPVTKANGATVDTQIIAFLQISKAADARLVCPWTPRIRDAIVTNLARRPETMGKKGLNLRRMGRRLTEIVHKSMGSKAVLAVRIGQMRSSRGKLSAPAYSEHALKC